RPPPSVLRPPSSVLCPLSSVLRPPSSVFRPPSSVPSSAQILALRQMLAERFPSAQRVAGRVLATGLRGLDEPAGGGLPLGAVTELVCAAPSCGGQLVLGQLLAVTRAQRLRVALVDGTDAFD